MVADEMSVCISIDVSFGDLGDSDNSESCMGFIVFDFLKGFATIKFLSSFIQDFIGNPIHKKSLIINETLMKAFTLSFISYMI